MEVDIAQLLFGAAAIAVVPNALVAVLEAMRRSPL